MRFMSVPTVEGMWSQDSATVLVPVSQTAFNERGMWVFPEQVPLHVLDALQDDLDRVESSKQICSFGSDSEGFERSQVHGGGWFSTMNVV